MRRAAYGVYTRVAKFGDWIEQHVGPLTNGLAAIAEAGGTRLSDIEIREGLAQIAALLEPVRGKVAVAITADNRVRLGEKLVFRVESRVAGRLALIDINAAGETLVLFPNRYVPSGPAEMISAGASINVPDKGYGFSAFQAVEPVGRSRILALVVPETFKIDRFIAPPERRAKGFGAVAEPAPFLMHLIRQIEHFLTRRPAAGRAALSGWGYTIVNYEIIP